jgi:hypothetical protein
VVEITNEVIEALKSDPVLTGLVNKRVYWIKPPGETYSYPFLSVSETGNTPLSYSDDEEYQCQVDIAVDIFSINTNLKPLKDAINSAMVNMGFERQTSGPDEYITELKCYHKTLHFTIEKTSE